MPRKITAQEYLANAIELSGKTQREIAREVGYDKANVLSMMKTGVTKIPIDKVPGLAKACGVDPKQMLRIVMQEYYPNIWAVLVDVLETEILSDEEKVLIAKHRQQADTVADDPEDDGGSAARKETISTPDDLTDPGDVKMMPDML